PKAPYLRAERGSGRGAQVDLDLFPSCTVFLNNGFGSQIEQIDYLDKVVIAAVIRIGNFAVFWQVIYFVEDEVYLFAVGLVSGQCQDIFAVGMIHHINLIETVKIDYAKLPAAQLAEIDAAFAQGNYCSGIGIFAHVVCRSP